MHSSLRAQHFMVGLMMLNTCYGGKQLTFQMLPDRVSCLRNAAVQYITTNIKEYSKQINSPKQLKHTTREHDLLLLLLKQMNINEPWCTKSLLYLFKCVP